MYTHGIEPFRTFSTNKTISLTLTEEVYEEKCTSYRLLLCSFCKRNNFPIGTLDPHSTMIFAIIIMLPGKKISLIPETEDCKTEIGFHHAL